jgi:protein-arginine kinase
VGLLSDIKLGLDTRLITGAGYPALNALFYRIKNVHLEAMIRSGNFAWEKDVADNAQLRVRRLRALVVQDALDSLLIQGPSHSAEPRADTVTQGSPSVEAKD